MPFPSDLDFPAELASSLGFSALFRDPSVLESHGGFAAAGFKAVARKGDILVGGHPSVDGYLFKRYLGMNVKKQLANYLNRIEGAKQLSACVNKFQLRNVVVPKKWIYKVPEGYVLVVEWIDLMEKDRVKAHYGKISDDVLRDLCVILFHFRGLDAGVRNIPLTKDGRVAFIDTEHWNGDHKVYLRRLNKYLSAHSNKLAEKLFEELRGKR